MRVLTLLMKPVSGLCNMRCRYCFYRAETESRAEKITRRMSRETLETAVRKALSEAKEACNFVFQGGEPTLAGLDFYREFISLCEKYNTRKIALNLSIQTNGLCINGEWAAFLKENDFLVGLSVDGCAETHDANRIGTDGKGSYEKVIGAASLLREQGVPISALCVISSEVTRRPKQVYTGLRDAGFDFLQFIPCITHGGENGAGAPTAKSFGSFLTAVFDLYYEERIAGTEVSVSNFEGYLDILRSRQPQSCDLQGRCTPYLTVEADGRVYPCDFYALDEFCLGSVHDNGTLSDLLRSENAKNFVLPSLAPAPECQKCRYGILCRGGCRRLRDNGTILTRNRYCEGYKLFFEKEADRLVRLAGR